MARVKVQQIQRRSRITAVDALWTVTRKNRVIGMIKRRFFGPKMYFAIRRGITVEICASKLRAVKVIAS